jgi:hypothetical protein
MLVVDEVEWAFVKHDQFHLSHRCRRDQSLGTLDQGLRVQTGILSDNFLAVIVLAPDFPH